MTNQRKRINIVSMKMIREKSILYSPRKITCPSDGVELAKEVLNESDREKFIVISLDTKNQPTTIDICSVGSLNASIVHPREVFKTAILSNAASILLAHNHPSGDPNPSKEDISITERLKEAGDVVGIKVLDHIIIGEDCYYSLKENDQF